MNHVNRLSILIVNWNTESLLRQCIESIKSQLANKIKYEIIVVDNASIDNSVSMIEKHFSEVCLIKNQENVGFGAANNQAEKEADGDYLLLLNSDAQIMNDELLIILDVLDKEQSITIATGKMIDEDSNDTPAYFKFPGLFSLITLNTIDLVYKIGKGVRGIVNHCSMHSNGVKVCDVDYVSGGYLFIRHSSLNGRDLFEDNIFMYFEDTLLCLSIKKMGHRVVYIECAPVMHKQGGSVKNIKKEAILYSYQGSLVYLEKTYNQTIVWIYKSIVRSLWLVMYLCFRAFLVFGRSSRIQRKAELFSYLLATNKAK